MDAGRVAWPNSGCTHVYLLGSISLLASWPDQPKKQLSPLENKEGRSALKDHPGLQSTDVLKASHMQGRLFGFFPLFFGNEPPQRALSILRLIRITDAVSSLHFIRLEELSG